MWHTSRPDGKASHRLWPCDTPTDQVVKPVIGFGHVTHQQTRQYSQPSALAMWHTNRPGGKASGRLWSCDTPKDQAVKPAIGTFFHFSKHYSQCRALRLLEDGVTSRPTYTHTAGHVLYFCSNLTTAKLPTTMKISLQALYVHWNLLHTFKQPTTISFLPLSCLFLYFSVLIVLPCWFIYISILVLFFLCHTRPDYVLT